MLLPLFAGPGKLLLHAPAAGVWVLEGVLDTAPGSARAAGLLPPLLVLVTSPHGALLCCCCWCCCSLLVLSCFFLLPLLVLGFLLGGDTAAADNIIIVNINQDREFGGCFDSGDFIIQERGLLPILSQLL